MVQLDFADEYPHNVVAHHVRLLAEAELLVAQDMMTFGKDGYQWLPKYLTPAGHDFLDSARDEGIWSAAKQRIGQLGGGTSLAVLKALLVELAKEKLGLGPGS